MPTSRITTLTMFTVVGFLCFGQAANAGTITFFTDRAAWVTAATNAGLAVTTEDFSTAPPAYPDLTVGGIDFSVGIRAGIPYDVLNQRIGYTSGGGRTLSLDYTGGSLMLFGFGMDLGPQVGNVSATDIDGVAIATGILGPAGHFVGLLGTAAFDPANPFPSNPALSGGHEFGTSGLGPNVYFDNLSVATGAAAVPEPTTLALLGLGLGVCAAEGPEMGRKGSKIGHATNLPNVYSRTEPADASIIERLAG